MLPCETNTSLPELCSGVLCGRAGSWGGDGWCGVGEKVGRQAATVRIDPGC